jgi:hypothetical protein
LVTRSVSSERDVDEGVERTSENSAAGRFFGRELPDPGPVEVKGNKTVSVRPEDELENVGEKV